MAFYILCGINSKHGDILKKGGGYILKMITKLYVTHNNDDTISFCYKSLITILVVMMMMMMKRWTVMIIWNILRMLLTVKYDFRIFKRLISTWFQNKLSFCFFLN
jgi:hypothetical protein